MPPQIHSGTVRGQNLQEYPSVQKFCACHYCADQWTIDRGSNLPVKGQYLGQQEWKRHRSRALKTGIASDRLARTPDTLLIPSPLFEASENRPYFPPKRRSPPHSTVETTPFVTPQSNGFLQPTSRFTSEPVVQPPPSPISNSESTYPPSPVQFPSPSNWSSNAPKKTVSNTKSFDFFTTKLKEIQISLKNSRVEEIPKLIEMDPLIFTHVPTQTATAPPSYDLDEKVARNSTIIGHEEWLVQTIQFINLNLRKERRDTHSRLLAKSLTTQAEKDLAYLRKEKVKEWRRQRASLEPAAQLDTCV